MSVEELRSHSITMLPTVDVTADKEWFATQPTHPSPHVRMDKTEGFAGYTPEQIIKSPNLLSLFNGAPADLAEQFLGEVPTLYSINAWWSLPVDKAQVWHLQMFHRDTDTDRFCVFFVYLNDVDIDTGPFQIIPGEIGPIGTGEEFDALMEKRRDVRTITGAAGTCFMANTKALHRGKFPRKPRLMAWARFGTGRNSNSADLDMKPLPWSECPLPYSARTEHINRLLFS